MIGFISGWRAGLPEAENNQRHQAIGGLLRDLGYNPVEAEGHWEGGHEQSWVVHHAQKHHLAALAQAFDQDAYLTFDRDGTGHRLIASKAPLSANHTKLASGQYLSIVEDSPETAGRGYPGAAEFPGRDSYLNTITGGRS